MPGPDIQPAAAAAAGPGCPALPLQPGRQPGQGGRQAGRAGQGGGEDRAPWIIGPRLNLAGVVGVAAEGVQQIRVPSLRQRPRGGFRLPDQEKVRVRRSARHGGRIRAKKQASLRLCDICLIFPQSTSCAYEMELKAGCSIESRGSLPVLSAAGSIRATITFVTAGVAYSSPPASGDRKPSEADQGVRHSCLYCKHWHIYIFKIDFCSPSNFAIQRSKY